MTEVQNASSNSNFDAEQLVNNVFNGVPWIDYVIRYRQVEEPLWVTVGANRLHQIQYLLSYKLDPLKKEPPTIDDLKYIYYEENTLPSMSEIAEYLEFLPNIRLVDFGNVTRWDVWISDALKARPRLCALRFNNDQWLRLMTSEMAEKTFHNIRALSSPIFDASKLVRHAQSLEQLFVPDKSSRDLIDTILSRATKLRRLHLTIAFDNIANASSNSRTNGGIEMLEVCLTHSDFHFKDVETFLNRFRRLKSLYIHISAHKFEGSPIKTPTQLHSSLEHLVITFSSSVIIRDWIGFELFITKCKNLRNLAIRNCCILTPTDIVRIVQSLPKLNLFDCRGCSQIKRPINQIVASCPALKNRANITYVQNDTQCKIPKPSAIQTGFDFMNNIFYQEFANIPQFLLKRN